jgi:hypothetical protein
MTGCRTASLALPRAVAPSSLDIDNEPGRPLFPGISEMWDKCAIKCTALFVPNFRFFRGVSRRTQRRAQIPFPANVSANTT